SSQTVTHGGNATAPASPTRASYSFSGWSGSYINITADTTITAQYSPVIPVVTPPVTPPPTPITIVTPPPTTEETDADPPPTTNQDPPPTTQVTPPTTNQPTPPPVTQQTTPPEPDPDPVLPLEPRRSIFAELSEEQQVTLEQLKDEGVATITIGGREIPLAAGSMGNETWALVNLILTAFGILLALIALVVRLRRRKNEKNDFRNKLGYRPAEALPSAGSETLYAFEAETTESIVLANKAGKTGKAAKANKAQDEKQHTKRRTLWLVCTIVLALLAVLLFILTEDMRKLMVFIDFWTIFHVLIFVVEVIAMAFTLKRKKTQSKY
ncbi:MAG: hypothetical protein FWE65_04225, partial [Eggerthellaceae bacterium]|nr:hypothetical protein [Eggerthellaceae bacterium]